MVAPRSPVEIALGDRRFRLRPLTLGQVERVEASIGSSAGAIAMGIDIVAIGLSRDHVEMTPDAIREIEMDAPEIAAAMAIVLRQGGFLPAEPGEAPAAAQNASTGAGSAVA